MTLQISHVPSAVVHVNNSAHFKNANTVVVSKYQGAPDARTLSKASAEHVSVQRCSEQRTEDLQLPEQLLHQRPLLPFSVALSACMHTNAAYFACLL